MDNLIDDYGAELNDPIMAIQTIPRRTFAGNTDVVSPAMTSVAGDNKVRITLDMDDAQRLNHSFVMRVDFEISNDGFATFRPHGFAIFRGHALHDLSVPMMVRIDLPDAGWGIRARVANQNTVSCSVGFVIESSQGLRRVINRG